MNLTSEFFLKTELESDYVETVGDDVDDDAVAKIKRWKRALDEGTNDPMYQDIEAMQMFNMSWQNLMSLPERVYLSMRRIHGLQAKHSMLKQQEQKYDNQQQWH